MLIMKRKSNVEKIKRLDSKGLEIKNIAINEELLENFKTAKAKHSKLVGFELTTKQFFTILLSRYWREEMINEL
tara:strand:+ start:3508 stop:3729 length:222 start_codon:yes stop_codon:yes gene_type:complete